MSEWSSEWGSGETREVTASVGEGVAAPRSPDSNLGRERETDRQSGGEGGTEGGKFMERGRERAGASERTREFPR